MHLCSFCSKNFSCAEPSGSEACDLCGGAIPNFLNAVASQSFSSPEGSKWFYVGLSSEHLKPLMVKEESLFDLCKGKSVKSALHEELLRIIAEKTSLTPSVSRADVIYTFNFPSPDPNIEVKPLYIYGKYSKKVPGISQKRWKKYEDSVEAIIGEPLKETFSAQQYFMHASGREDVDAVNVAPRPFVLELVAPQKRWIKLPKLKDERVQADLKGYVPPSFVKLVSDSHFDKSYRAYIDAELSKEEAELLNNFSGTLSQRTPFRVRHRRADLVRKRRIYSVKVGRDGRGFYLDIDAEAGTYIKEFISGDGGRTSPSVAEMLDRPVKCTFLIVTDIRDGFLDLVFRKQRIV